MTHFLGKAVAVTTLLIISVIVLINLIDEDEPERGLINSTALSKSGIKDLEVEYTDGKIYLNVKLITPQTCPEIIKSLGIRPIVIKSKIYNPSCSKINDSSMRITYSHTITT